MSRVPNSTESPDAVRDIPRFQPSPQWGTPAAVAPLPGLDQAPPERYEEVLAGLARFSGGVEELFRRHRPGNDNMDGFDSLYLGPSATFYLLHPHTHIRIAGEVLAIVHPKAEPPGGWRRYAKGGGWHHRHLSLLSGIQRVQIYRDGMGVTIQMGHPPNVLQLEAVREAFARTPMGRFAAEVDRGGGTLVTLKSFERLVEFVATWDPRDADAVVAIDVSLAGLYDDTIAT